MAKVYVPLNLSLTQLKNAPLIPVVQGDVDSRYLVITFWNGKEKIAIENTQTVKLYAQRTNGMVAEIDGVINEDGTVTVEIDEQVAWEVGNVKCTVEILGTSGEVLSSFLFWVRVTESVAAAESPADITPGDVLAGKKGYGKDGLVVGTIPVYDGASDIQGAAVTLQSKGKYFDKNINFSCPLTTGNITENGDYAPSGEYEGFSSVHVAVPQPSGTLAITQNGTVDVSAYASAEVNVQPTLGSKVITANGIYSASDEGLQGFSSVRVLVLPSLGTKTITENGIYSATEVGLDGFSSVTVNVQNIEASSFIKNYCEETTHDLTPDLTNGITRIRSYAFREDFALRYVSLASTVTLLNNYCFYNSHVQSFDSGAGLTELGERAFDSCTYLENVNIQGVNTVIKMYAFSSCKKLVNLTLGEGIKHIKQSAFYNCYKINHVILPSTLTNVDDTAFFVNTDTVSQRDQNKAFYMIFKRIPEFEQGSTTTLAIEPTKLGLNICKNRATSLNGVTLYYAFVPWDCYLVYKNYSTNPSAGIWNNCGVWIEAQENDILPTTSHQVYDQLDTNYTIAWYSDPALTTPVSIAPATGTYYGIITEVV